MGNLIDNALKYAPANGRVEVTTLRRGDGSAELAIADDGPGIPDADKPRAAQRFFRGDASRGTPGVGLGLSIVDAVARLHGGALELADNHPGLRACMAIESGQIRPAAGSASSAGGSSAAPRRSMPAGGPAGGLLSETSTAARASKKLGPGRVWHPLAPFAQQRFELLEQGST